MASGSAKTDWEHKRARVRIILKKTVIGLCFIIYSLNWFGDWNKMMRTRDEIFLVPIIVWLKNEKLFVQNTCKIWCFVIYS